jgi:GNAT superfamily N-acetyltransferase
LEEISSAADQYYIHDLAILPDYQGCGYAQKCIAKLCVVANRYASTCLVSVYGTAVFWAKHGFLPVEDTGNLTHKIQEYGDNAVYLERIHEGVQRPVAK